MADGTHTLNLEQEIGLLVKLRWRILRNQLQKKGAKLELLGFILVGILFALLAGVFALGFGAGAAAITAKGTLGWLALLFWAVLLFWQMFAVFFASLTTVFDFRTLLRFPIHLRAFFLMNVVYGLADPVAISAVIWLGAVAIGVASVRPSLLPAVGAVCFLFVLVNIFLERCIGAWLEKLLSRRRTRELLFALLILLMVSVQFSLPFLEGNVKNLAPWFVRVRPFLMVLPPGIAGRAIAAAGDGHGLEFITRLAGLGVYAVPFAWLLWRRVAEQYRGEFQAESEGKANSRQTARKLEAEAEPVLYRSLPGPIAAMMKKEFRYLFRNGITWLNILMPFVFAMVFTVRPESFGQRRNFHTFRPSEDWLFLTGVGYVMLFFMAPASNAFAYEGRGIQTLFTTPVRFRTVLLGKNLSLIVILVVEIVAVNLLLFARGHVPTLPQLFTMVAAAAYVIPAQLTIANWTSVAFPRKQEFGSMRNQRASGLTVLITLGTYLVIGTSCFVVALAGRWLGNPWIPVGVFLLLAAGTISGYVSSLDALSSLAEKKREVLLDALCK